MKRKYIFGALLAAFLLTALVYFYGGSQASSGQPPLRSLTAENVAEVKNEFKQSKEKF